MSGRRVACSRIYISIYICICIYTYVCVRVLAQIFTYLYIYAHVYIHMCVCGIHMHIYIDIICAKPVPCVADFATRDRWRTIGLWSVGGLDLDLRVHEGLGIT